MDLLIVDKQISFEAGIALVVHKMSEKNLIEKWFLYKNWDDQLEEVIHSINDNNIPPLEEDNFDFSNGGIFDSAIVGGAALARTAESGYAKRPGYPQPRAHCRWISAAHVEQ